MKRRNLLLLLLCVLLLVLPMICMGNLVAHGCAACGGSPGDPLNHTADPCRTLVRLEELGDLPPPSMSQPAQITYALRLPETTESSHADPSRARGVRPMPVYPQSDTPLRI